MVLFNENKDNYYSLKQDQDVLIFDREDSKYKGGDYCRDKRKIKKPKDDFEKYEPQQRDRGSDWRVKPVLSANSFDGIILGGGPIYYTYGLLKEPFETRTEITFAGAPLVNRSRVELRSELHTRNEDLWWTLYAHASELERMQFFGFGNETTFDEQKDEEEYYQVHLREVRVDFSGTVNIAEDLHGVVSVGARYVDPLDADDNDSAYIQTVNPYGFQYMTIANFGISLQYDTRNSSVPSSGLLVDLEVGYTPKLFNTEKDYANVKFDVRGYLDLDEVLESTAALRAYGEYYSNDAPFFDAAYLGGAEALRGYERERFSGQASALVAGEWRVPVSSFFYLFPVKWGALGFAETGRVFVEGESSKRWHAGYGGGLWLSVVDREFTVSMTYGRSEEMDTFYVTGGFGL